METALPTDDREVQSYFERSQKAWEEANRNRPYGPLPRVDYEWKGSWHIPAETDRILEELSRHIPSKEVASV